MEPTLVLLFPDGASRVVPLPGGGPGRPGVITLGRAADRAVEIDHPAVSRHHLRLVRTPPGDSPDPAPAASAAWRAEDTGSVNGTLRNGDPLGPGPVELRDGDCLAFGPDLAAVRAIYVDHRPPVNGTPADPDPDEFPAPGTTLAGRYLLEQTLTQTAEFQPYRATDTENDHVPVALKVFRPGTLPAAEFPRLVARVDRLRGIPSHPGVVRCLDVRRDAADRVFLVTRWVIHGYPTLDLLRARRALAPEEALRLLTAAAAASDHAAGHGQTPLDLSLRATLLTFHPPLANGAADWADLRRTPLERWRTFVPRFALAVLAPPPTVGKQITTLAKFACELLGRPLPDDPRARPPHIIHPGLGEAGNALLHHALLTGGKPGAAGKPDFPDGQAFVAALARAAELVPAGAG